MLAELPRRADREPVLRTGMGGDDTTAIDEAVEEAVVARFDASGEDFTLVSEELGVREGGPTRVVLDPIDGSINAKRGLPFFSLSVAVAEGGTMDDVVFGYVYDFGSGEEWAAERGGGARLNDAPLAGDPPKDRIELLALEATRTDLVAVHAPPLVGLVHRLRIFGSLALSLCHLADGRVDAVCSLETRPLGRHRRRAAARPRARLRDRAAGATAVRERPARSGRALPCCCCGQRGARRRARSGAQHLKSKLC